MDRSPEEAALDLGATPIKVFFAITLPLDRPGAGVGLAVAFTLSLDDVVIAVPVGAGVVDLAGMEMVPKVRLGSSLRSTRWHTLFILAVGTRGITANRLQGAYRQPTAGARKRTKTCCTSCHRI